MTEERGAEQALRKFTRVSTALVVVIVLLGLLTWRDQVAEDDRQDRDRLNDAVAVCELQNVVRVEINEGLQALVAAAEVQRDALGNIVLVAVTPSPNVTLTPEQQARVDSILASSRAQLDLVTAQLDIARESLLPLRDCDPGVVLADPNATVPFDPTVGTPTTTTPVVEGDP